MLRQYMTRLPMDYPPQEPVHENKQPENKVSPTPKKEEPSYGINLDYFLNCDEKITSSIKGKGDNATSVDELPIGGGKKKRGRPKKNQDPVEMVEPDDKSAVSPNLAMYESNQPYINSYQETNSILKDSIGQIDMLHAQVASDILSIRNNKSIRNKYHIISNLTSADCSLLSTKINAVKEMNKVITDSHNLDMKRVKEMNASINEQDDDKRIQDLYTAYMNAPTNQVQMAIPNSQEISMFDLGGGGYFVDRPDPISVPITPELNVLLNEDNPFIKEVVIQDDTQPPGYNLRFAYIDTRTGEDVPGLTPKDPVFLSNLSIDPVRGIARDTNLNISYDLIVKNKANDSYY